METKDLFKNRSVTACMQASYNLISTNLTNLIKKTWWAILPYSILMAIGIYLRMPNKGLHDWGESSPTSAFFLQTLAYALILFFCFITGAVLWNWISKRTLKSNIVRFTCIDSVFYLTILVLGGVALAANLGKLPVLGMGILLLVLSLIFLSPFAYIIPKYMLRQEGEKFRPWSSFKTGLHHFGSIFKMGFLCCLILFIILALVATPVVILTFTQISSQVGALNGDPIGVPAYFWLLYISTIAIVTFIFTYIMAWLWFAFAYLYGSIETQEKEKKDIIISHKIDTL